MYNVHICIHRCKDDINKCNRYDKKIMVHCTMTIGVHSFTATGQDKYTTHNLFVI